MTAQERIEGLLNKAGQTIDDLPFFYKAEDRKTAKETVRQRMRSGFFVTAKDYQDFVCHQSDVIDRLEWALEKTLARIPKREERLPAEEPGPEEPEEIPFTDADEEPGEAADEA